MATEKTKKPAKKPTAKKPASVKKASPKSATKKPVTGKPMTSKSMISKPMIGKAAVKTTAKKSTAAKSVKKKEPIKKPVTGKSMIGKPATGKVASEKPAEKETKTTPLESSVITDMVETVAGKVSGVIENYRNLEENKGGSKDDVKADIVKRLVAKFVDLLIAYVFVELGNVSGFLLAVTYILASDGFSGGSIGKRLVGVKVVTRVTKRPVNLMESAIRNAVFAAVIVVYFTIGFIPYIGKLIALATVIAIGVMEVMLIFNDKDGIRYGDKLAGTMVIDKN